MILQMTKRTVYYPAPHHEATNPLGKNRRVRCFRTAFLVNQKAFKWISCSAMDEKTESLADWLTENAP